MVKRIMLCGITADAGQPLNDLMTLMGGKKKRLLGEPAFAYKFKEGHSKNFRQDLKFEYFLR